VPATTRNGNSPKQQPAGRTKQGRALNNQQKTQLTADNSGLISNMPPHAIASLTPE